MRFDAYRQAITPIYITKTERQGGRIDNAVIDPNGDPPIAPHPSSLFFPSPRFLRVNGR